MWDIISKIVSNTERKSSSYSILLISHYDNSLSFHRNAIKHDTFVENNDKPKYDTIDSFGSWKNLWENTNTCCKIRVM